MITIISKYKCDKHFF